MKWMVSTQTKNQMSLFYTLFSSFIMIILLLVSINMVSYTFFRSNIKDEIIVNSGLNLNTTVTNYEKHIKLIRSFMLGYLFNTDTQILKSTDTIHYDIVTKAQKELQHTLNNSLLYLDNIIYYFRDSGLVIDKEGTRNAETMFSRFYIQSDYSIDFWNKAMEGAHSFKVYPSAEFNTITAFEQKSLGSFMPILIKSAYDQHFAFIALLKSDDIYEAFHQTKPGSSLIIMDENRNVIFSSPVDAELPSSIREKTGNGYERNNNIYYFYRTGIETGFTYVEIVSDKGLTEQIHRLNVIMLAFIVLSLLISLIVSYLIAKRFHNPLANMLRSIQSFNAAVPSGSMHSRIKEFNMIHNTLNHLSRSNQEFHEDLQSKNTLLQQFAYMARLKSIHGKSAQLPTSIDANKPYRLILFQIDSKDRLLVETPNTSQRALNIYKELIDAHFSKIYADSLTFQLEKDQILSILFIEDEIADEQLDVLDALIRMLEIDSFYYNFTIALSPAIKHAADFAETYQNVLELVKQRRLGESVQVITECFTQPTLMIPSPSEESELTANLHSGADSITIPLVNKLLDELMKADSLAQQFQEFSRDVINKTLKAMYIQKVPDSTFTGVGSPYDQLKACHTLEQYQAFFQQFLSLSAASIKEKKSETDVMTKFVMEYVESHYGDDLSLDAIAGMLGITGPYLSTYFKEKTGINFSDYIFTIRMNKAMNMLRDTDLKVQEIAPLIGYYTVASFNRVFKRHTGITPSEYRRQHNKWQE